MNIFVTGIGTGVGKTIVSGILLDMLGADYWKPIQAGNLELTDGDIIKSIISNKSIVFHDSSYSFKRAMSPHAAAFLENIKISADKIITPKTKNNLIIEGAGGILVPINQEQTILDIIKEEYGVVLVSSYYLGSINHTLMSAEILKKSGKNVLGIIFNGEENKFSRDIIEKKTKLPILLDIPKFKEVDKQTIRGYVDENRHRLEEVGLKVV